MEIPPWFYGDRAQVYHKWALFWLKMLLYHPVEFASVVYKLIFIDMPPLPPLITRFILPLLVLYYTYRLITWLLDEYQAYLDLGRGGTPPTFKGLMTVTYLKTLANINVLEPPHIPPLLDPYRGMLFNLKNRLRPRPLVKGVAPQRQFDQRTEPNTFNRLATIMQEAADNDPDLIMKTSFLERHTTALMINTPLQYSEQWWGTDGEWNWEICHPHRIDGSFHINLHPEDVRWVIEKGWGELHCLSKDGWFWKFFNWYFRGMRRSVPPTLCFIYAPDTKAEWDAARQIISAGIWWNKDRYANFVRNHNEKFGQHAW